MKNGITALIIAMAMIVSTSVCQAQEEPADPPKTEVTMKNGEVYVGTIVEETDEQLILQTENGKLYLVKSNIKSLETLPVGFKYAFQTPNATRYFFSPSAKSLKKGEGYYQNVMVSGNFVNYGITDYLSVGGGLEFISLVTGDPILFFTPKVGTSLGEKTAVSAGLFLIRTPDSEYVGITYGSFTFGSDESNVTLGGGWAFSEGEFAKRPVGALSAIHRVHNSICLVTENYMIPLTIEQHQILPDGTTNIEDKVELLYFGIHGIRVMTKKNSFDIGAIVSSEFDGDLPALPYVGYVRQF